MEKLYRVREECARKLLNEYEEYLYNQKDLISQLPKLYYVSNGKGGWLGGVDSFISKKLIPINIDRWSFVSLDDLKIYRYTVNSIIRPTIEDVFSIRPEDLDFNERFERLYKSVYEKENDEVSQTFKLEEWVTKAIKIDLDVTFEDALLHYKGISEKYVLSKCKDEYEFENFKSRLIVLEAKKSLNLNKTPSYL